MLKFSKVSFEQFKKDCPAGMSEEEIKKAYDNIKLPKRATKGSAGYDFFAPFTLNFLNNDSIKIPTGIRCNMDNSGGVLIIAPRSGLGFKFRMALNNTIGVIDSDYFHAENEGHILIKMHFDEPDVETTEVQEGKAFAQGIFLQYFTTDDDEANGVRTGGFGSTTK